MATVAFTDFLPEVLPKVPSCPNLVAVNAVRNAAIEFCTRTLYWHEMQDMGEVSSGGFPFYLEAPAGARVCKILSVRYGDAWMRPTTRDVLDLLGTAWEADTGAPQKYLQETPDTLTVYPLPETAANMYLRVAFCPKRDSTTVDSTLFEEYLEGIAAGALYRLMSEPGQAYSNDKAAQFYGAKFAQAIGNAKLRANQDFTRDAGTVQIRSFA